MANPNPQPRPKKKPIEYVKVIRNERGKIKHAMIKKILSENKQYMAENHLEIFVEPNSDEIKDQLAKDREAIKEIDKVKKDAESKLAESEKKLKEGQEKRAELEEKLKEQSALDKK